MPGEEIGPQWAVLEITPGLLRWSTAHPDHDPDAPPASSGDWDPLVGSVLFEAGEVVVLIDPLLPRSGAGTPSPGWT